jgi:hypothetical protein
MSEPAPAHRHEPPDVDLRGILYCAAGLVAIAVVIHVGAWLLFRLLEAREARAKPDHFPLAAEERQREQPPRAAITATPLEWSSSRNLPLLPREPRLEGIERMEGKTPYVRPGEVRVEAAEELNSYQWVNREQGVVQIPLRQAMDLIAEQQPAGPPAPNPRPPSRANSGRSPEGRQP